MTSLEAAKDVIRRLREAGFTALLAGGCVRDHLLGLDPKDHDVATDARPEVVVKLFRRTKCVGAQFGVVLVSSGGREIEVATFRTDSEYSDGRRPDHITFTTAEGDAQRRDFTINGMFYDPFADQLIDYVGGQADLAARLVRCIGEPERRFAEDHLRMLRAVRFAARLDFAIEPATFAAMKAHAAQITRISPERIRMELELILTGRNRAEGWRLIVESGLHEHLADSATWTVEQAGRGGGVLASLAGEVDLPLAFAAILFDRQRTDVARFCRDLRCSNDCTERAAGLVDAARTLLHQPDIELADVKHVIALGLFGDAVRLARAAAAVTGAPTGLLEERETRAARVAPQDAAPPPLVTGDDLTAWGIPPGRIYGSVLEKVYRAQRNEMIHLREEALAMARALLAGGGYAVS